MNPFWEDDVSELVGLIGADHVIFGSDWPHIEGLPQPLDYLSEVEQFDEDDRRRILRDNVRSLNVRRPV
jgi:predicted TIM-barrel fold metal-dependent hydrolase